MVDPKKPPLEDPANEPNLVEVSRVQGSVEAEVIKSFLDSHGIRSLIRGQIAHMVYPIMTDGLGELRIMVPAEDADAAHALLADLPDALAEGLEPPEDGEDPQP